MRPGWSLAVLVARHASGLYQAGYCSKMKLALSLKDMKRIACLGIVLCITTVLLAESDIIGEVTFLDGDVKDISK